MSDDVKNRVVVVGASAAGLRAASRARRLSKDNHVIVIDKDSFISYGACGMPYFVSGDIENPNALRETPYGVLRDPDYFRKAKGVEVLTETEVKSIDRQACKVFTESIKTGEKNEFSYDNLVLATGATPTMIPGVAKGSERIMTFKTLHDAIKVKGSLQKGKIGKVCIIGAGFIGLELTESFCSLWGAETVLIEAAESVLPGLIDREIAASVEAYLKTEDVEVHTGCPVESITDTGEGVLIKTRDMEIEADLAIVAVGVRPSTGLAIECGLDIGELGGIVVDETMRTSDKKIFAAGDCVEVTHKVTGLAAYIPLGSLANRQGRIAGSNIGGVNETFGKVVGSSALKAFDLNICSTGVTEERANRAGLETVCAWGSFNDKADYFPGSANVHFKLVLEKKTLRLLGLQGYGQGEVVKRADVFSALLKNNGTLDDLLDMEYAYAPPFAPALDPLFSLGCVAKNALFEEVALASPGDSTDGLLVVDVRMKGETEAKPITDVELINIPFEELRERWKEIPTDKPLMVMCAKGPRSGEAFRILKENGFNNMVYLGGGWFMRPQAFKYL